MKDKHIYIAQDNELLSSIYRQVNEKLIIDQRHFVFKIWTKFIFYFSLSAFCYSLLYRADSPLYFIFCFILFGFASILFAFNFSHDFSHNTIFRSKKLNNLCFIFIYTLVGAHAEAWKQRHIHSHHYAPNVEDYDSDLKISKLIRVIPDSKHYWYHRYQHLYAPFAYTTYSLFWVFIKDFVILFSKDGYSKKKDLTYHLSFWAQKSFYLTLILILPLLFSRQSWYIVLTGFTFMHLLQS
jgi:linoleoyl-CoA desaturase